MSLYPGEDTLDSFGLPNFYKDSIPQRPVRVLSVAYNISKHLASIQTLLVGRTEQNVKNSLQDFADRVRTLSLDPDETAIILWDTSRVLYEPSSLISICYHQNCQLVLYRNPGPDPQQATAAGTGGNLA